MENTNVLHFLLDILNINRACTFTEWYQIGKIIFNMTNGTGIEYWIYFSQKSKKYVERSCYVYWDTMKYEEYNGIFALKYLARIDNPKLYKKFFIN